MCVCVSSPWEKGRVWCLAFPPLLQSYLSAAGLCIFQTQPKRPGWGLPRRKGPRADRAEEHTHPVSDRLGFHSGNVAERHSVDT